MSFQRIHHFNSQNPQPTSNPSLFASRPFAVPEPQRTPTQPASEDRALEQDNSEATELQLKAQPNLLEILNRNTQAIPATEPVKSTQTPPTPTALPIQPKLTIEEMGDRSEEESDWVAEPIKTIAPLVPPPIQRQSEAQQITQPNLLEILLRNPQPAQETEAPKPIQRKLTIGQPNDFYEQEADRVAAKVLAMPEPKTQVQRQELPEAENPVQMKCETCEQEELVQRSADGVPQVQPDLESRLSASQSGGTPLPNEVRSFMEPRFGADFSQVRVHTDGEAVQMNRELGAQAFTHGSHIYYGAGKSPAKDELTGHELTHVVQQTGNLQMQQQDTTAPEIACGKQPVEHEVAPKLIQGQKQIIQRQRDWSAHQAAMDEGGDAQGDFVSVGGTAWCLAMTSIGLDDVVVESVVKFFQLSYPMAYDHLIAYLSGTGERPYDEPIENLFSQNPRVAERISRHIQTDGSRSGIWFSDNPDSAPIRQVDYDLEDWRLALGNIDEVQWEVLEEPDEEGFAEVRIAIRDPYIWSPQDERFTDCFHELFERERTEGHARVFEAWGIGDVRLQVAETGR